MFDPTYNVYCKKEKHLLSLLDIRNYITSNIPYEIVFGNNRNVLQTEEYRALQIETYFQFDVFLYNTYNTFLKCRQKRINISPNGFDGEKYRKERFFTKKIYL